jgi:hypothetical protein
MNPVATSSVALEQIPSPLILMMDVGSEPVVSVPLIVLDPDETASMPWLCKGTLAVLFAIEMVAVFVTAPLPLTVTFVSLNDPLPLTTSALLIVDGTGEPGEMASEPLDTSNASSLIRLRIVVAPVLKEMLIVPSTSGILTSSPVPGTRPRSQFPG